MTRKKATPIATGPAPAEEPAAEATPAPAEEPTPADAGEPERTKEPQEARVFPPVPEALAHLISPTNTAFSKREAKAEGKPYFIGGPDKYGCVFRTTANGNGVLSQRAYNKANRPAYVPVPVTPQNAARKANLAAKKVLAEHRRLSDERGIHSIVPQPDPLAGLDELLARALDDAASVVPGRHTRGSKAVAQKRASVVAPEPMTVPPRPPEDFEADPYDPALDDDPIERMYQWGVDPDEVAEIAAGFRDRILALPDHASLRLFIATIKPLVAGWYDLAEVHDTIFDALLSPDTSTLCIVSRNTGKSTIAQWWCVWKLLKDPYQTILHLSRSVALARRNLRACRMLLDKCPVCAHLKPTDACLQSNTEVEVPAAVGANLGAPSLSAVGVETAITGRRCTILVADDIEVADLHFTTLKAAELYERFSEALALLSPGGICRIIGTPHGDTLSFYFKLLRSEDSPFHLFKAAVVREEPDPNDGRRVILHSLWPQRWTPEELKNKRAHLTLKSWRQQYLIEIEDGDSDRRPLRISSFAAVNWDAHATTFPVRVTAGGAPDENLKHWGVGDRWCRPSFISAEVRPWLRTIAVIDVSSGLYGRDPIGFIIGSATATGSVVIRHWRNVQGNTTQECIIAIATICREFLVDGIYCEEMVDGLFSATLETELLRRQFPCKVEKLQPGGINKITRIIHFAEPPLAAGRLIILDSVIAHDDMAGIVGTLASIQEDATSFKRRKGIDAVDAFAYLCSVYKDTLAVDVGDALGMTREEDLDLLRYRSMRNGGLIGYEEVLLQEDETEVNMQASLEDLMSVRGMDLREGRKDQALLERIETLRAGIEAIRRSRRRT